MKTNAPIRIVPPPTPMIAAPIPTHDEHRLQALRELLAGRGTFA